MALILFRNHFSSDFLAGMVLGLLLYSCVLVLPFLLLFHCTKKPSSKKEKVQNLRQGPMPKTSMQTPPTPGAAEVSANLTDGQTTKPQSDTPTAAKDSDQPAPSKKTEKTKKTKKKGGNGDLKFDQLEFNALDEEKPGTDLGSLQDEGPNPLLDKQVQSRLTSKPCEKKAQSRQASSTTVYTPGQKKAQAEFWGEEKSTEEKRTKDSNKKVSREKTDEGEKRSKKDGSSYL